MKRDELFEALERYFDRTLEEHGPTARGVDWNSPEAQEARFGQLLRICPTRGPLSIIDYGCGVGALAHYMLDEGYRFTYVGFDVNERMLEQARRLSARPGEWEFVSDEQELRPAGYVVASGIFNLRLDIDDAAWLEYVFELLASLDRLSEAGFAFNMLTKYSDPDRMRPDLYYADPGLIFDHCKRNFARNVALLHDYDLYEFTILVRKETPSSA